MKKIAIITDSNSGISQEEAKSLGCFVVPMPFIIDGEIYFEGVSLEQEKFYEIQKSGTKITTSQPNINEIVDMWKNILKEYDEIIYVLLSSGLSEACNTAINASHDEEFEGKVFVANNQRVSFTNKIQIYQAAFLIKEGKSAKEIKEYLEQTKTENGIYIAVDTLKYLKKGGRVTPAAAAIGTLLNIKPILQIHGGKLDAYAKVMSMRQARAKMLQATRKEIEERFPQEAKEGKIYVSIAHSVEDLADQVIEDWKNDVKGAFTDIPFFADAPLPLFIACHTGPNALATGYVVDRLGAIEYFNKK